METPRLSFLKDEEPYFCKEFLLSSVFDSRNKDLVKHKKEQRVETCKQVARSVLLPPIQAGIDLLLKMLEVRGGAWATLIPEPAPCKKILY